MVDVGVGFICGWFYVVYVFGYDDFVWGSVCFDVGC